MMWPTGASLLLVNSPKNIDSYFTTSRQLGKSACLHICLPVSVS